MHGVALPVHLEHVAHAHAAADMPMPETNADVPTEGPHAGHGGTNGDPASPHAAHQCTCPGGCCATAPVALLGHTLRVPLALTVVPCAAIAAPTDSIELAQSPQLALPLANAPPAFRITLRSAAQQTT